MLINRRTFLLLAFILAGCRENPEKVFLSQGSVAQKSYPYELRILIYHGVAAYSDLYYISRTNITIVRENDFGWPARELGVVPIDEAQSNILFKRVADVLHAGLDDQYITRGIADGMQMHFHFLLTGMPEKNIGLSNLMPKELYALIGHINSLLPKEHVIYRPRPGSKALK